MEEMKKRYLNYLANKINVAGGKAAETLESIVANLQYLAELLPNTEDKKRYIPLAIKRILLWLVTDGDYTLTYSAKDFKPGAYVIATATITYNNNSTTVDYMYTSEEVMEFGISEARRNKLMVNLALGSALTRAITQSGIGLDIIGDIEDDIKPTKPENQAMDATVTDKTVKLNEEKDALEDILNKATDSGVPVDVVIPDKDLYKGIVVTASSYKGKTLGECPPKIAGWVRALVETDKVSVSPEEFASLKEYVDSDEAATKQYTECMSKAK